MTNNDDLALKMKAAAEAAMDAWRKFLSLPDDVDLESGLSLYEISLLSAHDAASNPANILSLLAERDADKKRIADLEAQNSFANEKVEELVRLVQYNLSRAEDAERRAERISKSSSLSHPGLLHATNELVFVFSHALADKLYAAQQKYNHGTSWREKDWEEACQRAFHEHVAKGDPRDVAAYCAFMWWHGWNIKPLEARTVSVKLQRYDLDQSDCDSCGQDCGANMSEEPDGDYVLFSDVVAQLAAAGINLEVGD